MKLVPGTLLRTAALMTAVVAAGSAASLVDGLAGSVTALRLPSGMQMVLAEMHDVPVITFHLYVSAGGASIPDGKRGVAAVTELLVRSGPLSLGSSNPAEETDALAAVEAARDAWEAKQKGGSGASAYDIQQAEIAFKLAVENARKYIVPSFRIGFLQSHGITINGGIGPDATNIIWTVPASRAELWFKAYSENFQRLSTRDFYQARDALRENAESQVEKDPGRRIQDEFIRAAFPDQPYSRLSAPLSQYNSLRPADAQEFYRTQYAPGNMVLVIAGDLTAASLRGYADTYMGNLPAKPAPALPEVHEPASSAEQRTEVRVTGPQSVAVGWRRPALTHPDNAVFEVLAAVLRQEIASDPEDFTQVRQKNIAVQEAFPGSRLPSLFAMFAGVVAGSTPDGTEKAVLSVLDPFRNAPPSAESLVRAKASIRANLVHALDARETRAEVLAFTTAVYGDWRAMETNWDKIDKVTPADVQRVVEQYFKPANRVVVHLTNTPARGATAQ